jgi:hypothetical protein
VDFVEDNAIATTARIPTGNSMFSSFTGTSAIHPILSLAVFHGGRRTFLAQRMSALPQFGGVDFEEDGAIAPLAFPDMQVSVKRLLA